MALDEHGHSDNLYDHLPLIASEDIHGLRKAFESYGDSWCKRGGVGAFMVMARKWDRLENFLSRFRFAWDIFKAMMMDARSEGIIDDIRDLRRYLMLIEAKGRAMRIECAFTISRDNLVVVAEKPAASEAREPGGEAPAPAPAPTGRLVPRDVPKPPENGGETGETRRLPARVAQPYYDDLPEADKARYAKVDGVWELIEGDAGPGYVNQDRPDTAFGYTKELDQQ